MQTQGVSSIPAARRRDPASSHMAADAVTACGARAIQAEAVLRALRKRPGHTSAELAVAMRWDRFMPARRLPELEKLGLVYRGDELRDCSATGRKCVAWWPK